MLFQRTLALRGPNLWARFPVLEAWVDLENLKDLASSEIPGFNARLKALLPTLAEHHCSEGRPGGFHERLERGTYLAHILEHVVLELQSLAGTPVRFGKTRLTSADGVYKVAVAYKDEEMGQAALEAARELVLAAVHGRAFDVPAAIKTLAEIVQRNQSGRSAAAVLAAAKERRIPARLIDKSGLIQLGYGARQRRVLEGQTDASSAVANGIAYDRILTRELLASVGVPVPYGRVATSAEDACAAARVAELPVVVRPKYVNAVAGSAVLSTEEEVAAAYQALANQGYSVLVEHATPGTEWRLLVIGNKLVSARPIAEPPAEFPIATLHPRLIERILDAVSVIGLDVAEVVVAAVDPSRSLEDQDGTVISVHAQPDFAAFLHDGAAQTLVDHLFPEPRESRVPIVSVSGTNGKTTTTRLTAHLLGQVHAPVGMCCTEGIYIGSRRIMTGDCSGPKSAKAVLHHAEPRAAVVEVARGGILREGLGFDRCDVAIVTNIGDGDHLGANDIDTPEQLANVKSTIVWSVHEQGHAVLNAHDPLTVDMKKWCSGKVIYFARDESLPVVVDHRAHGGKAAFVRDNTLILADGQIESPLVSMANVPLTQGGRVGFHVENVLAAAAAAWVVGVPLEAIRRGLESFAPKMHQIPARFNIMDINGVTVVLDYGHNTSAVARLLEVIEQFPHPRRTVVYSAAGDRRDADIVAQGEQLGRAFDRVIIYEDTYLRGRAEGEITGLFKQGMAKTSRVVDIRSIKGGMLAIEIALAACTSGDLLVIQPDRIDDGVALLTKFVEVGGREMPLEEALRRPKPSPDAERASGEENNLVIVTDGRLGKAAHATRGFVRGDIVTSGFGPTTSERSMHTIQIDRATHLVPPSPMRFLNHSCEPNCGLVVLRGVALLEVHALRDIAAGEELTLDYETFEEEFASLTGPCLCQSAGCRGKLRGYGSLSLEVRSRYGIYVAEYLREADEPIVIRVEPTVTVPHTTQTPAVVADFPMVTEV